MPQHGERVQVTSCTLFVELASSQAWWSSRIF